MDLVPTPAEPSRGWLPISLFEQQNWLLIILYDL